MSGENWTPGPWEVHVHDDGWKPVTQVRQVAAGGHFGDYHEVICCNTSYYPTDLDPRNAHLIAAGPTLYEALKKAADRLAEIGATVPSDVTHALAKARGEA